MWSIHGRTAASNIEPHYYSGFGSALMTIVQSDHFESRSSYILNQLRNIAYICKVFEVLLIGFYVGILYRYLLKRQFFGKK